MKKTLKLSENAAQLKLGLYKHYKGNYYRLLGIGRHTETLEEFAIYHPLDKKDEFWVRPLSMFCEKIRGEGNVEFFRFSYIEE